MRALPLAFALALAACAHAPAPAVRIGPTVAPIALPDGLEARAATPLSARVVARTRAILASLRVSEYVFLVQHSEIDETAGVFETNCTGFVTRVLADVDPRLLVPIPRPGAVPRAVHYYDFFSSLPDGGARDGWARVHVTEARPGDVLVWRFPEFTATTASGHAMIVIDAPRPATLDGKSGVMLRVVDSAGWPHFDDTRAPGQTGLGAGDLFFVLDERGDPIEYRGYPRADYARNPTAVGRPVGNPDT